MIFRGDVIFGRKKYTGNIGLERWFGLSAPSSPTAETFGLDRCFFGTFDVRKTHHPVKSIPTILFPLEKIAGINVSQGSTFSLASTFSPTIPDRVWYHTLCKTYRNRRSEWSCRIPVGVKTFPQAITLRNPQGFLKVLRRLKSPKKIHFGYLLPLEKVIDIDFPG